MSEFGFEPRFVRQGAEEGRVEQRIDDLRLLRENVGETRCDAENERDEAQQFRILPQQRKKAPTGAQAGEKAVEIRDGAIRIFAATELFEQQRNELGEIFARLLALERIVTAGQPAAHGGIDLARLAETHFGQLVERIAIFVLGGKRQIALFGHKLRRLFEQPGVVLLHLVQMRKKRLGEIVAVLEAEEARKVSERFGIARQSMGLLVRHHLQPMLDAAQEAICRGKVVARRGIDPAAVGKCGRASVSLRGREVRGAGRRRSVAGSARRTRFRECRRGQA